MSHQSVSHESETVGRGSVSAKAWEDGKKGPVSHESSVRHQPAWEDGKKIPTTVKRMAINHHSLRKVSHQSVSHQSVISQSSVTNQN